MGRPKKGDRIGRQGRAVSTYGGAANRKGSDNFAATLTEEHVREARRRHAKGESCASLARDFGVHDSTMSRALRRLTFQHVR